MASQPAPTSKVMKPRPTRRNKLATLPSNAQVTKRPLLRPPIPSRYSNADSPKVVYVSASTPFLSAVKRVEKLLRLADQRLVQSATSLAKGKHTRRGRRAPLTKGVEAEDEIGGIAEMVEQLKDKTKGEEVTIKGTGRAIPKVMEMGVWFQQREEFAVSVHTGTVSGIDDIEYEEESRVEKEGRGGEQMDVDEDVTETNPDASRVVRREETTAADGTISVSETRIRKMSVLELHVSLR